MSKKASQTVPGTGTNPPTSRGGAANWRKHDTYQGTLRGVSLYVRYNGVLWSWTATRSGHPQRSGAESSAAAAMTAAESAVAKLEAEGKPKCRRCRRDVYHSGLCRSHYLAG